MRAFGRPSASTVASVMALASEGSARLASSNQAANSRKGSSASVKSPAVNSFRCCIGDDSDIPECPLVSGGWLRPERYRGSVGVRLCAAAGACGCARAALTAGGCSMSYQLDSMSLAAREAEPEHTGSVRAPVATTAQDATRRRYRGDPRRHQRGHGQERQGQQRAVGESDAPARAAPSRRCRPPTTSNGTTCRDFLASYVRNGAESWMQGEACRGQQGRWEVRHMKPWRRT